MNTATNKKTVSVIFASFGLLSTTSWSQGLEEVVVTAQKREQSLQDVGVAVSAFSNEQLNSYGVDSSIDVARITPSVHVSGSIGGQNSQFTIRGVI